MTKEYTAQDVRNVLLTIADEMIRGKETFTEIDGKLGDGDMGQSMEKAALAIRDTVTAEADAPAGLLLLKCGAACNRAAPSTLGTLLSVGMMALGKAIAAATALDGAFIATLPTLLADEIAARGKAHEGDKTILDALYPYARAMRAAYAQTGSLREACMSAADAAHAGMESTKGKPAKIGRAKWLAERNMDCPDGGAVLCDRVARRLCETGD